MPYDHGHRSLIPIILLSVAVAVAEGSAAQGFQIIDGSFGTFVGTETRPDRLYLGEILEVNITVKSLYADECHVSIGLEVEAVTPSWQDETLGRLVNGSALLGTRTFVFLPNSTINVILEWDTSGPVTLEMGHIAHAWKGEYHLEFERDDCDGGGGGAIAVGLFEVPRNYTVVCPRIQVDFMGSCRNLEDVVLHILVVVGLSILAAAVVVVAIFMRRRGKPPESESPARMPPAMPPT